MILLLDCPPSCARIQKLHRCPLVSVVVTNFNYGRFVEQAIQSVAAQSYESIECVVVDDASTDGSFGIILRCIEGLTRPGFRALRLGTNLGQMGAFKEGLESSSGPFVVFLDADDYFDPLFVETHVRAHLNGVRPAAFTASDTFTVDEAGTLLEGTYMHFARQADAAEEALLLPIPSEALPHYEGNKLVYRQAIPAPLSYRAAQRAGWPYSGTSSFMFRRDVLRFGMPENTEAVRICADYYLVQFASSVSGSILIHQPLGYYRIHQTNGFASSYVTGASHRSRNPNMQATYSAIDTALESHVSSNAEQLERMLGPSLWAHFDTHRHTDQAAAPTIAQDAPDAPEPFEFWRYLSSRRYRKKYNDTLSSAGPFNFLSFITSRTYRRRYVAARKLGS